MQHIQSIIEAIKAYETIIIHRHVRPDPDAFGSQAALKDIISESFPSKYVFITGEDDPSLEFLTVMDDVDDETYQNALVIVCDTANAERISDQRYHLGQQLIKIDHHPNVGPYGDILWVDTEASSTSEMIYDLYLFGKDDGLVMTDESARLIYAGIVGDTGRFLFPSSTKKTFQHAAELVAYNFDRSRLYDGLYRMKDNIARLRGYVLQHFTRSASGMSTVVLTKDMLDSYGVLPMETGQLVGVLGDIQGVKAWAFFIEEDDLIRVRLRSNGPVVNGIASAYNGGGHPMAAGASISTWEQMEHIMSDLDNACQSYTDE
ncbi:bifunctional oligoribonuclease/PAP phosphatase NrnA [Lentibacillus halophilus]|uniref:Bifunctional oligoribonuclease/PAP phosphatase NrnA n=2 Tax=Lentibacillus halophilus TaxID=295065 RepID=A0ABP3IVT8_9BACI